MKLLFSIINRFFIFAFHSLTQYYYTLRTPLYSSLNAIHKYGEEKKYFSFSTVKYKSSCNRRANRLTMNSAKIIRERQRSLTFTVFGPLIPLALRRGGLGAANFLLCSRIIRFEVFLTFEHVRHADVRVASSIF